MFALSEQKAKLVKFTPYVEMHGADPVSGSALHIEANMSSLLLGGFHPELRAFLYHKQGALSHDLADITAEIPDLRFERFKLPLQWRQRYDDSLLTLHIGDLEEHALELAGKVKKPFLISPMQGGTVVVRMTYHCHPQNGEVGKIYNLMRNEITVSFDPGREVEGDDDEPPGEGGEA